jgi:hypothetical protein
MRDLRGFLAAGALLAVACGGNSSPGGFPGDAGNAGDPGDVGAIDAGGPGDAPAFGDGSVGDDGPTSNDCPAESKLVYVVSSDDRSLYSFYPPSLEFTKVGPLSCEAGGAPFAMSVARDGYAWVLYDDGNLFRVSTKDAACSPTAFAPGQQGFTTFGMGFSADVAGGQTETLYGCWTQGLAKIDTKSLVLTPVGPMTGLEVSTGCDLTGTGTAQLFSFVQQPTQWVIAQIDKTTSAPTWQRVLTPPIPAGGSWGTSFWGGDLYLYTTPGAAQSSVWRYRPSDQTTVQLVANVGFTIVGAGESTCVPTTPPK